VNLVHQERLAVVLHVLTHRLGRAILVNFLR
jgi:hypothetical protein